MMKVASPKEQASGFRDTKVNTVINQSRVLLGCYAM